VREKMTEELFNSYLSTAEYPEIDLMIRTSLDYRLSNFLLWQLSYTELYFTDTYWPDFTPEEFEKAINNFTQRSRRFGGLKDEN
ncbi:MAG: undecaprenyl diphosphate synthase family protein, partial [Erysipelotrichaceae bacterium]|nr:undecaprenyl diphosphate synthase family protein [Erysipelotrichaceae bacterium]